jgi:hypothetical protein
VLIAQKYSEKKICRGDYTPAGERPGSLSIILIFWRMRKWLCFRCLTTVEFATYLYKIKELPWAFLCKDGSEIPRLILEVCATDQVLFGWCSWLRASAKLVLVSSPKIR